MNHVLDNPVWNALISHNKNLGDGLGGIRYFYPEVSPFAAMEEDSEENLAALYSSHPGKRGMFLWTSKPLPSFGAWTMMHCIPGLQMIHSGQPAERQEPGETMLIRKLDLTHVPAMLELTALTVPGPFDIRTIEFGNYEGIFCEGRLAAMTGQRFHCPGHVEVSAVCTHPDFLGKGYARRLVSSQVRQILAQGEVPFLHVRADNERAIEVYERVGFRKRMQVFFYVLKK